VGIRNGGHARKTVILRPMFMKVLTIVLNGSFGALQFLPDILN
jgi:hypothetical protein